MNDRAFELPKQGQLGDGSWTEVSLQKMYGLARGGIENRHQRPDIRHSL